MKTSTSPYVLVAALLASPALWAQSSTYRADYTNADYSGFSTVSGGVVQVPYILYSGDDLNGGSPFIVDYNFSALSNGFEWKFHDPAFPNQTKIFGVGAWELGDPTITSATLSISSLPTIAGYDLTDELLFQISRTHHDPSGNLDYIWMQSFDGINPRPVEESTDPYQSHFGTQTFTWVLVDGAASLLPADTEGYAWSVGGIFAYSTFLTYSTVPEPSGPILLGLTASLSLLRRRRAS